MIYNLQSLKLIPKVPDTAKKADAIANAISVS